MSAATISRVENGQLPDLENFLQLVEWLGISECSLLFPDERRPITALERVALLLECELEVDHELVEAIVKIVRMIHRQKGSD